MIKHAVCYAPYIRNHTSYDRHLWHTSLKWWYLQVFFYFFQILIFQVVSQVKSEKLTQNDKKFCLSCSMSQEPYIIWSSLVIRKCKMIISLGFSFIFFFFFFNFDFLGCWGGERAKNGLKWQKTVRFALHLRNYASCDRDFWYTYAKWWHLQILFSFFHNFDFLGC